MFLLDHLLRYIKNQKFDFKHFINFCVFLNSVNSRDGKNKMSLHNLATVFGPTLLRPAPAANGADNLDLLAMGTIDVMAQAGILHFFLLRKQRRVPIQFPSSS
jgi:breakpoint cluster region protein